MATSLTFRDFWYAMILSASLAAGILLFAVIYYWFIVPLRQRRKIKQLLKEAGVRKRLQILKERRDDKEGGAYTLIRGLIGARRLTRLQTLMLQADVFLRPTTLVSWMLFLSLGGVLLGFWVLRNILLGALLGVGFLILPLVYLRWKKLRKAARFERQMPDALELLARSLRAGHTLLSGIELLGEEMPDPLGTEMKIVFEDQKYGLSVGEAMQAMLRRVDSVDLRYFVSAILLQQTTGGNLAALMETLAFVIRSRLNFKAKLRGLTASGRLSAVIMIITPIITFFLLLIVAPVYEKALLTTSRGRHLLALGMIFILLGSFSLRKLLRSVESSL